MNQMRIHDKDTFEGNWKQVRGIPVVDNRIVGIIAQAEIATRFYQPDRTAEMVKEISQANGR